MTSKIQLIGCIVSLLCLVPLYVAAQDDLNQLSIKELETKAWEYHDAADYKSSIPYFEALIQQANQKDLDTLYVESLLNLASILEQVEQLEQAETTYLQAKKECAERLGEAHGHYSTILNYLGALYQKKGMIKEAEEMILTSIDIQKKAVGEAHLDYANIINRAGIFYFHQAQFEKTIKYFETARNIRKKLLGEDHKDYAQSLNNCAVVYQYMGLIEEAEVLLLESIEIRKRLIGEEHPDYAGALNNLAYVYNNTERYEEAKLLFLEALEIIEKVYGKEHTQYAGSLNNLGMTYHMLKEYDKAEAMFKEGCRIKLKVFGVKNTNYAAGLNNLATMYQEMGRMEEAEALLLESTQIRKDDTGELSIPYAESLNNLGMFYVDVKQYKKAEKHLLKALELQEQLLGKRHNNYLIFSGNLSLLYKDMHQFEKAIYFARQGIEANSNDETIDSSALTTYLQAIPQKDFYSQKELFTALYKLFQVLKKQHQVQKDTNALQQAYHTLQSTMIINEKVRNDFASEASKLRILSETSKLVSNAIATGLALSTAIPTEELFEYAEMNKSILLADATKSQRARALSDLPDSLVLLELSLAKESNTIKKQKNDAKTTAQKADLVKEENNLNNKINAFMKNIKANYPKHYALKYENTNTNVASIQALLDDQSILLEYFVAKEEIYLFAVQQDTLAIYTLPITRAALSQAIKQFRKALSNYTFIAEQKNKALSLYSEQGSWFYKNLLEIAVKNSTAKNLIIITDGELGHLPFEAFLTKDVRQSEMSYNEMPYLIHDFNISYDYSASLWKNNRNSPKSNNNNKMLACAASYHTNHHQLALTRAPITHKLRKTLLPLPAAEQEVKALSEIMDGDFLTGKAVNERFFKDNVHQYSIVHMAMHGILHPRVPILSSLALTENGDSLEDNFLQAYEIAHLQLNADLVVISACETGFGKFQQGEGVLSLARSFMYAGTPSLVVSLWQVNDASTAVIMKAFYQYLQTGLTKSEALKQAKLDYINLADGIAAHPAFWSAFIQLGDSRPIVSKRNYTGWILGSILLITILGLWAYRRKKYSEAV